MVDEVLMQKIAAARRKPIQRRRVAATTVVKVPVMDERPGYRDARLFDLLGGFSRHWHVIEGRTGPGSQYKLKHALYAWLHELHQEHH